MITDYYEPASLHQFFKREVGGLFQPDDWLCILALHPVRHIKVKPFEIYAPRDELLTIDKLIGLRQLNNNRSLYFSVCPLLPGTRKRCAGNVIIARALWADFDSPAPAMDAFLRGRGWCDIPAPDFAVSTSQGRYQFYWQLPDDDKRSIDEICAEVKRIARITGADLQATDAARVLRLPGYKNRKKGRAAWECKAYRRREMKPINLSNRPCPLFDDVKGWSRAAWLSVGVALRKVHGEQGVKYWLQLSERDETKWPGEEAARAALLAAPPNPYNCDGLGCRREECGRCENVLRFLYL
ncbi:MAG: DNA-primase RepB domain-containing protein [Synergistaceae bacterium]|nr:DNA-primase RepB domain-containing protein [Synergistaceae bacterium]